MRHLRGRDDHGFTGGFSKVLKCPALVEGGWNDLSYLSALRLTSALVVGEEEELVLEDGAAEVAAEDVANEFARSVGFAAGELCLFVEEVIGYRECRTMILISSTVEAIGARLGDETNLRAGGASGFSVGIARGDAELFDRILSQTEDASEGEAVDLIVVVDAIESKVALVGTFPVDCAAAAILQGGICGRRQIDDTGLE